MAESIAEARAGSRHLWDHGPIRREEMFARVRERGERALDERIVAEDLGEDQIRLR